MKPTTLMATLVLILMSVLAMTPAAGMPVSFTFEDVGVGGNVHPFEEPSAPDMSNIELLTFVGRKVSVTSFEPEIEDDFVLMDAAFIAKYEVLDTVYGDHDSRFIEFEVYDHYGYPAFAAYETVLLFLRAGEETTPGFQAGRSV